MLTDAQFAALKDTRDYLANPAHWIKHRAYSDTLVDTGDGTFMPVSMCLSGALLWHTAIAMGIDYMNSIAVPEHTRLGDFVAGQLSDVRGVALHANNIPEWNDSKYTAHEDIVNVLDRAVAAAEAERASAVFDEVALILAESPEPPQPEPEPEPPTEPENDEPVLIPTTPPRELVYA